MGKWLIGGGIWASFLAILAAAILLPNDNNSSNNDNIK